MSQQVASLNGPDNLDFDFNFPEPLYDFDTEIQRYLDAPPVLQNTDSGGTQPTPAEKGPLGMKEIGADDVAENGSGSPQNSHEDAYTRAEQDVTSSQIDGHHGYHHDSQAPFDEPPSRNLQHPSEGTHSSFDPLAAVPQLEFLPILFPECQNGRNGVLAASKHPLPPGKSDVKYPQSLVNHHSPPTAKASPMTNHVESHPMAPRDAKPIVPHRTLIPSDAEHQWGERVPSTPPPPYQPYSQPSIIAAPQYDASTGHSPPARRVQHLYGQAKLSPQVQLPIPTGVHTLAQDPAHRLAFHDLGQAQAAMSTRAITKDWRSPGNDDTVPQSNRNRAAYVVQLLDAMEDTTKCKDKRTAPAFKNRWTPNARQRPNSAQMEKVCWELLGIAERLHASGPSSLSIYDAEALHMIRKSRDLTFEQRIENICALLRLSKNRCFMLLKNEGLETTVGAPAQRLSGSIINHGQNDRRQGLIVAGRGVVKLEDRVDQEGEDDSYHAKSFVEIPANLADEDNLARNPGAAPNAPTFAHKHVADRGSVVCQGTPAPPEIYYHNTRQRIVDNPDQTHSAQDVGNAHKTDGQVQFLGPPPTYAPKQGMEQLSNQHFNGHVTVKLRPATIARPRKRSVDEAQFDDDPTSFCKRQQTFV